MSDGLQHEAIKKVAELAVASLQKKPSFLPIPNDPLGRFYIVDSDGKLGEVQSPPPKRHAETVYTIEDLIAFVKERVTLATSGKPVAYIDEESTESLVRVVYDQEDRRDFVRLTVAKTEQWSWIENTVLGGDTIPQRDLVRLLRVTFDGCVGSSSNILQLVRSIKFTSNSEGASNIQHGNESVGRSIIQQTRGEEAIPEFFDLNVNVYEQIPYLVTVRVYIEPRPGEQAFYVRPFPRSVRSAIEETIAHIKSEVSDVAPAYLGTV